MTQETRVRQSSGQISSSGCRLQMKAQACIQKTTRTDEMACQKIDHYNSCDRGMD